MEQIRKTFNIKSVDEKGIITAYASVFDVVDYENDIIKPGAFTETLKSKVPVMLWNHDSAQPIGKWIELKEDDHGLYVTGQLLIDSSEKAREVYALIKDGAVSGLSIGFGINDFVYEGNKRLIKEVTLFEISIVSIPCCDEARIISVKSVDQLESLRDIEKFLKAKGMSNAEAKKTISAMKRIMTKQVSENVKLRRIMDEINGCKNLLSK